MKVLIIPEDPVLDRYVLQPIVERMFASLGRRAAVDVLENPRLRGVEQALDAARVARIVDDNAMVDLFLVMVDRDCERRANTQRAMLLEQQHPERLIACVAVEEIEVWMLAAHRDQLEWNWADVRSECDAKERFATVFLERKGWSRLLAGGRKEALRDLGDRWNRMLSGFDELRALLHRLSGWLAAHSVR